MSNDRKLVDFGRYFKKKNIPAVIAAMIMIGLFAIPRAIRQNTEKEEALQNQRVMYQEMQEGINKQTKEVVLQMDASTSAQRVMLCKANAGLLAEYGSQQRGCEWVAKHWEELRETMGNVATP